MYPQAEAFHQSQPGPVHQARHEPSVALDLTQDGFHLLSCQDHGQSARPPPADDVPDIADLPVQNVPIQEQERAERLILR